jgi:hypothetical protein
VGQLTIERSRIALNTAVDGRGGGISTMEPDGSPAGLVLRDSVVENNTAGTGFGGGIVSHGGATIERSIFRGNIANQGGAVLVRVHLGPGVKTQTRIDASALVANTGMFGSAISTFSGVPTTTRVTSSTVSGNITTGAQSGYGAVYTASPIEFDGVTLVDNRGGARGGIYNVNTQVGIFNTILAANRDYTDAFADCGGSGTQAWVASFSRVGQATGCDAVTGPGVSTIAPDRLFLDVLAPLASGDMLPAHAPLAGSVVLDAGDPVAASVDHPSGCTVADQYGRARPQDDDGDGVAVCDIGAVEGPVGIFLDGFEDPA